MNLESWDKEAIKFIELTDKHQVRMLMVGGGAVNFHGYQRHSADVDFWIDMTPKNLNNLKIVFHEMGYDIKEFPEDVLNCNQNISLKFSPKTIFIELITRFSINKSFEEAFNESELVIVEGNPIYKWRVLNFDDLILSKIKLGRPKDLLDIQELNRIKNK